MDDLDDQHPDFPSLDLADDTDELPEVTIKLAGLIEAGKKITDSRLYGMFTDDHLPCFNVSVTVDSVEHKFCAWWVSGEFAYHLGRAPFVEESATYIIEYINSYSDPLQHSIPLSF